MTHFTKPNFPEIIGWKRQVILFGVSFVVVLLIQLASPPAFPQSGRPNPAFNPREWDWYDCPVPTPGQPTQGSNDILGLPLAMKLKFPLDLIYPINPKDLDIDSKCMKTELWGIKRDMCSPMQVAKIAKNVFLLKITLQSLLSL
jgi:hypothetical protein